MKNMRWNEHFEMSTFEFHLLFFAFFGQRTTFDGWVPLLLETFFLDFHSNALKYIHVANLDGCTKKTLDLVHWPSPLNHPQLHMTMQPRSSGDAKTPILEKKKNPPTHAIITYHLKVWKDHSSRGGSLIR
jgi:hypothetical protein